ncbi:MAG TPA: lysylphosphatidylglycerol synthase domain-containing protein [Chitinophagaceae bacterium]|nr:lysylphosphatidylglycerol synthase domain-containing protein [Chitinophagaceae bacterium]
MQWSKSIKIFFNYLLGPLLFAWLLFFIYRHIQKQPNIEQSWEHIKTSFQAGKALDLILVFVLMFVNWGIEARKWQISVLPIRRISYMQAFKAILSGVSFSVTTPNRVGEYVGRMLYMPEGSRLKSISVTLVGSLSQLLVTFLSGIVGLILLKAKLVEQGILNEFIYRIVLAVLVITVLILSILYWRISIIEAFIEKWFKNSRYLYLIQSLRSFNVQLLGKLLLLSFLRYLVFIVQYYLVFFVFDVDLPVVIVWSVVSVLFLSMAIIPTIALVEVGLRGEISLQLMALFTSNSLGVGLTSVTIWLINLVLPAVVGCIFILSVKAFKSNNEIL